ncbi:MAG: diaminopropionate ammonia-lyase [Clostridia bacterium]|nr:diaminopropionate ammonia-lyase [Clostridia bacterium]
MSTIACTPGRNGQPDEGIMRYFTLEQAEKVTAYHRDFPGYCETALTELPALAEQTGVRAILIKDESTRFGLNAFKALGSSYAAGFLGENTDAVMTATDGNHGRGLAYTARVTGRKCTVFMPAGSARARVENIRKEGAEVIVTDVNYDDTVRMARDAALETGAALIQDTAWEGYETVPLRIMQGYLTMAAEATDQLGDRIPTHVFLQAGVGSMAAAVTAYLTSRYGTRRPDIYIVEPMTADCCFRSGADPEGKRRIVRGDLKTIMAGLACGEPCTLAWEILRDAAAGFLAVDDDTAAEGMRRLARPAGNDPAVVSGESGAAGFGAMLSVLTEPKHQKLRQAMRLDADSVILCFSTEGDTDPENRSRILEN